MQKKMVFISELLFMILFAFIIPIQAQTKFSFESGYSFYNFSSNDFIGQAFFYDFFLEFSIAGFPIIAGNYGMVRNFILEYNPLDTDFKYDSMLYLSAYSKSYKIFGIGQYAYIFAGFSVADIFYEDLNIRFYTYSSILENRAEFFTGFWFILNDRKISNVYNIGLLFYDNIHLKIQLYIDTDYTDFMTTFNMFARFKLARGLLECSGSFFVGTENIGSFDSPLLIQDNGINFDMMLQYKFSDSFSAEIGYELYILFYSYTKNSFHFGLNFSF